jgi:hypothetical protein
MKTLAILALLVSSAAHAFNATPEIKAGSEAVTKGTVPAIGRAAGTGAAAVTAATARTALQSIMSQSKATLTAESNTFANYLNGLQVDAQKVDILRRGIATGVIDKGCQDAGLDAAEYGRFADLISPVVAKVEAAGETIPGLSRVIKFSNFVYGGTSQASQAEQDEATLAEQRMQGYAADLIASYDTVFPSRKGEDKQNLNVLGKKCGLNRDFLGYL